jgi:hypothetical protein
MDKYIMSSNDSKQSYNYTVNQPVQIQYVPDHYKTQAICLAAINHSGCALNINPNFVTINTDYLDGPAPAMQKQ